METTVDPKAEVKAATYTRVEKLQLGLFWAWNLIFLAFMSLGFAPVMLPETLVAVRTGTIPAAYLLYALLLSAIPVASVILGLTVLRTSPRRLFALGYVVEAPLMLLLAVRFFAIRQGTPGTTLLFVVALLGIAAFLWSLLDTRTGQRRPWMEGLRTVGLTLMALVSLYAAVWIAFYAIPLGVILGRGVWNLILNLPEILKGVVESFRDMLTYGPMWLGFSLFGFPLLIFSATLFVLAPIAVPFLSLRTWWQSVRSAVARHGRLPVTLTLAMIVIITVGAFFLSNRQPQQEAFALLENPPASSEEARSLLSQSEKIRAGLVNAYLAPYRYISAHGEVRHVTDLYISTFKLSVEKAFAVQRLYENFTSPLLYKPVHSQEMTNRIDNLALAKEPQEAAVLYQRFFDTPIIEAERPTIVQAVRSTWSSSQAESAWQAVDDREVRLVSQAVSIQDQGDWAEFELHEVYQNQTGMNQEVIYYFNLPESAVLTGVWLGNTPEKERAFPHQVAPRGAAQAVYREQTRVMKDPALLEQIGPRQYRLRVFPVPPLRVTYDSNTSQSVVQEAFPLYVWMSWRQMRAGENWPMPALAHLENVYWDEETVRTVNGEPLELDSDEWLPASLPAAGPVVHQVHQVDLPGGQTVLAIPAEAVELPALPEGLRLAVVVDRSYSMEAYAPDVAGILEHIRTLENVEHPVDVYLTASPYRGEEASIAALDDLNSDEIVYFGGQDAAQLIAQFASLYSAQRSERQYDAVLVLTDATGYELGESHDQVTVPPFPVWLVHVGGELPLGYDDQTQDAIQASGGGVTTSLDEALSRMAVSIRVQQEAGTGRIVDLVDGYLWAVLPTDEAATVIPPGTPVTVHEASDPFAALAARRVVLAEMQRNRGVINQVETLDALHALAMEYEIVTPYSSMIVLVTSQQKLLLDQLSQQRDRYQREVEGLGNTSPGSPVPLVGVPEPHEWLLIGLAVAFLLYMGYQRYGQQFGFRRW